MSLKKFSLVLSSPGKVNLFLRILGKRHDGYHQIATLMQTIHLSDKIFFSLAKQDSFTSSNPLLVTENLICKAVTLFRKKTGLNFRAAIHLEKNLPIAAGLGGGSSNAATTLLGLAQLLGNPVTKEELKDWSAELGMDVPFFFSSGMAYCEGRGEVVRDVAIPKQTLQILQLFLGLSTPKVYQELQKEDCSLKDPEELLESFANNKPLFVNDLEKPACRLFPFLQLVKRQYSVMMSGSGPTCFCSVVGDPFFHQDCR